MCYTPDRKVISWAITITLQVKRESTNHFSIREKICKCLQCRHYFLVIFLVTARCYLGAPDCSWVAWSLLKRDLVERMLMLVLIGVCFHGSINYYTLFKDLLKVDHLLDGAHFIHKYLFYLENGKICKVIMYIPSLLNIFSFWDYNTIN